MISKFTNLSSQVKGALDCLLLVYERDSDQVDIMIFTGPMYSGIHRFYLYAAKNSHLYPSLYVTDMNYNSFFVRHKMYLDPYLSGTIA